MYLRRSLLIALAIPATVLAGACAAHQSEVQTTPAEVFAGHVTVTADGAWFTRCGDTTGSKWWVTFTEAAVAQADRAKASGLLASPPTFVRWTAVRTDGKQVGPGGPALLVREILDVRAPAATDCSEPQ
jgi:hypothetical protein